MWQSCAETEDYSAVYSIALLQLNHIIAEILSGLTCICRYSHIYEAHMSPALHDSPIKDCSIEYFHHITRFEALYCIMGGAHKCMVDA